MAIPQINQLADGCSFMIRNAYGDVYKTIMSKMDGKYVFDTSFITSSPGYVMDGTMLHKIPLHIKRLYFQLMRKIN